MWGSEAPTLYPWSIVKQNLKLIKNSPYNVFIIFLGSRGKNTWAWKKEVFSGPQSLFRGEMKTLNGAVLLGHELCSPKVSCCYLQIVIDFSSWFDLFDFVLLYLLRYTVTLYKEEKIIILGLSLLFAIVFVVFFLWCFFKSSVLYAAKALIRYF